jgi:hypothetical protein
MPDERHSRIQSALLFGLWGLHGLCLLIWPINLWSTAFLFDAPLRVDQSAAWRNYVAYSTYAYPILVLAAVFAGARLRQRARTGLAILAAAVPLASANVYLCFVFVYIIGGGIVEDTWKAWTGVREFTVTVPVYDLGGDRFAFCNRAGWLTTESQGRWDPNSWFVVDLTEAVRQQADEHIPTITLTSDHLVTGEDCLKSLVGKPMLRACGSPDRSPEQACYTMEWHALRIQRPVAEEVTVLPPE